VSRRDQRRRLDRERRAEPAGQLGEQDIVDNYIEIY
jgi:hypothetical protein